MRTLVAAAVAVLLAGCGSTSSWMPWSRGTEEVKGPRTPKGATVYGCEGNKRLYVRYEADAKSAFVIFPDREFRLDRTAASGEQYSNGRTTLSVTDGEATLQETGGAQFTKCKREAAP